MGFSKDYPDIPDWVEKPEGYQADEKVKYEGNVFVANFWASKPGEGDANENGWRLYDELYDVTSSPAAGPARIIGYIPTWRKKEGFDYANKEMYRNITHGIISFLMFSETNLGEFTPESVTDVEAILADVVLTAHECGTYISIAIGGATDYGFLALMERIGSNPGDPLLQSSVQKIAEFVDKYGLDGVDLDLECWWDKNSDPSKDQGGRLQSDGAHAAGKGLTEFAKQLKQAMPGKLISAALFATSWYGNCYDPGLVDHVDWLGIMTYDLTGSWDQTPVGPQTALYKIRDQEVYVEEQQGAWPGNRKKSENDTEPMFDNPILSVEDSLWYWTNPFFTNWQGKGPNLPRNKIAAGVPIYGYDFAYGKDPDDLSGQIAPGYKTIRYKDLITQFPEAPTAANANIKVPGSTPSPPFVAGGGTYPYAHNIYFETPDTAVTKLNFLKSVGTQGVIIWELSNDVWGGGQSIVQALYSNSGNPATRPALPSKPIPRPEEPEEPGSDPDNSPFPWDLIGRLPDDWGDDVQVSSASQDVATRGLDENLNFGITGSPAIAVYKDKLYCVHQGKDSDGWLWYCHFDGERWSKDTKMDRGTFASPAVAVYQDKLHCIHEGQNGDGWLWHCIFDGQGWSDDKKIDRGTGTSGPGFAPAALAEYKGLLHCVHEGQHGDGWLWHCTYDGINWSDDKKIGRGTTAGPALAVIEDRLYCFHEGQKQEGWLWVCSFDGTKWSEDTKLEQGTDILPDSQGAASRAKGNGFGISGPPGLYVDDSLLYVIHQGRGDDGWVWSFSNAERTDKKLTAGKDRHIGTSFTPGLALFKGQFHILHHGQGLAGWLWGTRKEAKLVHPQPKPKPPELEEPKGGFNLKLPEEPKDRPAQPYGNLDRYNTRLTESQSLADADHPVVMARHHVIPYSQLRKFWNTMIDNDDFNTRIGGLLSVFAANLGQYPMTLVQDEIAIVRLLIAGIISGAVYHDPEKPLERPPGFDGLSSVYTWIPGNLFIGPKEGGGEYQRTDDPGDSFETNANVVVGSRNFNQLKEANGAMQEYLNVGNSGIAQRAVIGLGNIARRKDLYPINSSNWTFSNKRYELYDRDEL